MARFPPCAGTLAAFAGAEAGAAPSRSSIPTPRGSDGSALDCGHDLAEEAPEEIATELLRFFGER